VNSSRPRTWRNFGNTCYISSVSQLLSNVPEFQWWCSVNGVLNVPTLTADPDTVHRYIFWTRSVGLQTQADGSWQSDDPLRFLAYLCSVLSQGREATSLLEIFKITSDHFTKHTGQFLCYVCYNLTMRLLPRGYYSHYTVSAKMISVTSPGVYPSKYIHEFIPTP
jgi:hypothetical protein